jgi:ribonuclease HI
MWFDLGLSDIIEEALVIDRARSAVLEHLLKMESVPYSGFDFGLKETIVITFWYIWWIRRRKTHEDVVPSMSHCKMSMLAIAANSAKVQNKSSGGEKWSKPDVREIKVNVDGSFHYDSLTGLVGAVLRDNYGKFIAAYSLFLPHIPSAKDAEARAMKEGLDLANRMGCSHIVAESDSMEIIEACTGESTWFDESAAVFVDCVDIATLIGQVSFRYCPRDANRVAHEIASFGFLLNSLVIGSMSSLVFFCLPF